MDLQNVYMILACAAILRLQEKAIKHYLRSMKQKRIVNLVRTK